MTDPGSGIAARERELREELRDLRKTLRRIPEPPEPLTAGELAAGLGEEASTRVPLPRPPPTSPVPTLFQASRALGSGEVSSFELVSGALERARSAKRINAFVHLREEALAEARRSDERRGGAGPDRARPLEGIPLSVKDIVDVAGLVTTSGSRFPRRAARSAPAWETLRRAGAILIGKNNLQEFAYGLTGDNPTFGRVRNPRDPSRVSGGSSSGSAAAVAAGIGCGSIGTDTGGSIRIPAALTGVFGLKPSYGRVSRVGVTPLSWSLDHVGPLAASAFDIGILWSVLGPGTAGDRCKTKDPGGEGRESAPLAGVRFGVPLDFFYTDLTRPARTAAEEISAALERLGAERIQVRIPEAELAGVCRDTIAFAEAFTVHRRKLSRRPREISGDVRALLRLGSRIAAADFCAALAGRRLVTEAFRALFRRVDALVVPTAPTGAPRSGDPLLPTGEPLRPGLIRLVGPFNLTGLPALQIPAGTDAEGMPLGAQLVAGPGAEETVIRLAGHLEASGEALPLPVPSRLR